LFDPPPADSPFPSRSHSLPAYLSYVLTPQGPSLTNCSFQLPASFHRWSNLLTPQRRPPLSFSFSRLIRQSSLPPRPARARHYSRLALACHFPPLCRPLSIFPPLRRAALIHVSPARFIYWGRFPPSPPGLTPKNPPFPPTFSTVVFYVIGVHPAPPPFFITYQFRFPFRALQFFSPCPGHDISIR